MGAGASTGSVGLKSKVLVAEGGGDHFIPLKNLASHLRVYQHCTTGEVLVLVDDLISDTTGIVDVPADWFQVSVCKKESKYLETLRMNVSLNDKEHSMRSNLNTDKEYSMRSMSYDSTPIAVIKKDSERSLLDPIQLHNTEVDGSRKYSDSALRTTDIAGKNIVENDPFRKSKLPPINQTPLFPNGVSPATRSNDTNIQKKKLLLNDITDPENIPLTPESPTVDSTVDSNFGSPSNKQAESALRLTSKKGRLFRNVLSSPNGSPASASSTNRNDVMTHDLDVEFESITRNRNEGNNESETLSESTAMLARLVRENLLYNTESRTYCCQICGDIVGDDSYPVEQVE